MNNPRTTPVARLGSASMGGWRRDRGFLAIVALLLCVALRSLLTPWLPSVSRQQLSDFWAT
jgi:hypothetical protein